MKLQLAHNDRQYFADTSLPIDISIPVSRSGAGPNAFYLSQAHYNTVRAGNFVGNVQEGGSCNVEDILLSPHGNGTHTECAGHISGEAIFINDVLKQFLFLARLITITPESHIITEETVNSAMPGNPENAEALVIRTLPNPQSKKEMQYSGTDPIYFSESAIGCINRFGINHILTDLPSLDKEDDTRLQSHHAFFEHPGKWNLNKTVTEMIYVPDLAPDGLYLLNLQIISLESDASPSKPVLYALKNGLY